MKKTLNVNGLKIEIDVTAYVKWENRAIKAGKTVEELLSIFLTK